MTINKRIEIRAFFFFFFGKMRFQLIYLENQSANFFHVHSTFHSIFQNFYRIPRGVFIIFLQKN